jgi:putative two-component system response regulator
MNTDTEQHTTKPKILVVDDDETIRHLLADELKHNSYEVETAGDGGEAIETVRKKNEQKERFDVVVLDLDMPRVDGWEALKYIKENTPETRVIMVTASGDIKNSVEAVRLGASDFVSKPCDPADVLTSIKRVLAK